MDDFWVSVLKEQELTLHEQTKEIERLQKLVIDLEIKAGLREPPREKKDDDCYGRFREPIGNFLDLRRY